MLKSNNFNSVVNDLSAFSLTLNGESSRPVTVPKEAETATAEVPQTPTSNGKHDTKNAPFTGCSSGSGATSLASQQLTAGILQSYAPPMARAKEHLKELIQKQNKIYIDLSAEKFKLDNAEVAKLNEMMNSVKVYREKLLKIKKQMQNIYQRTKVLKKKALNIQTCKERELQRKLQKQQQEESLIAKQPQ